MNFSTRSTRWRDLGKAALAGVLVALLFISTIAAGSSDLHEKLHSDHSSPTHVCLVSMLDHGHAHAPVAGLVKAAPASEFIVHHVVEVIPLVSFHSLLFSGRGPPCLA